jgi:hypothetical protein
MKNCIVIITCLLIAAGRLHAQQGNQLIAGKMPSLSLTNSTNSVHVKAMRDFLKRNEAAEHVEWMQVDNGYVVKYHDQNDLPCRSVYNSKGCYRYTIKQYGEDRMNEEVRRQVKSMYYDYTITLVEEVELPLKPVIYIVHLENSNTLKNLRVSDGYIEVIEDYRKQ